MKSFKTPFTVCWQNIRKWSADYRIIVIIAVMLVVSHFYTATFHDFTKTQLGNIGIAPWSFVFSFTGYDWIKIMLFLPLLLLFSDAPFIDANQPYIISRCTRRQWSIGQVLYIIAGSGAYVIVSYLCSLIMIAGNMEITTSWGKVITTAAKSPFLDGAGFTGVSDKVVTYFTPFSALFYTMLLMWFSCIFLGLLIYVINSITKKNGYGVMAAGFFVLLDFCFTSIAYGNNSLRRIYYFSPISWCSVDKIKILGSESYPTITYVLCGYAVLIAVLSVAAVMISRKQQIDVMQGV